MSQHFGENQAAVEELFRRFQAQPASVPPDWRTYFEALSPSERSTAFGPSTSDPLLNAQISPQSRETDLAWRMSRLVTAYRSRGHYYASIDPLGLSNVTGTDLVTSHFGIRPQDMDVRVPTDIAGFPMATLRELIAHLDEVYCGTVGYEVMHVEDPYEREWLLERIEGLNARPTYTASEHLWMLEHLTDGQELERFLHTQYVGAKRFSLEGLEALLPMLTYIIDFAGGAGVSDIILGMAHRGRLNVLVNVMRKSLRELFTAFNDKDSTSLVGRGDVKYHLGYATTYATPSGRNVNLALCFNPSHLEFVDPVVNGRARARMDRYGDPTGRSVLPLAIHGDAAFAGQGIVMETLNLAELQGYRSGGTIHIVLNNQVGFTTSPSDSRSSRYSSDVVRFMRVPVFHVNAEDIDAVMRVTHLAAEYRQTFLRDVCIDLVGYRRYGHNEGDEPRFTQPKMYAVIDQRDSVRDRFAKRLIESGELAEDQDEAMIAQRRMAMMDALQASRQVTENKLPTLNEQIWDGYYGGEVRNAADVSTSVDGDVLRRLLAEITQVPDGFAIHPKVERIYQQRSRAFDSADGVDWGTAEMLAYASMVAEGHRVRLSGQDCRRGTFSHRHSYVVSGETGEYYSPLSRVAAGPGGFEAYDSPLSEAAVLGFEYGYSLEAPDSLVIWEAQFGDFANGAQVIIDQFIASGEDKWGRLTGLTMLLPHGFEGQGPEHSYARLGRFLQLCAEDNMQVCDCTTPAQLFHLLRRQLLRPWRKPLVVMSPKSLLRHKRCVSSLEDLSEGSFQTIIDDTSSVAPADARRVLLCSGRLTYDLEAEREKRNANDVHIVRIEQLYPLDEARLTETLQAYGPGTQLVWVQDEPWNMGAWYFIKARLQALYGDDLPLQCVARAESASPATGSGASHRLEHTILMEAAFAGAPSQLDIGSD